MAVCLVAYTLPVSRCLDLTLPLISEEFEHLSVTAQISYDSCAKQKRAFQVLANLAAICRNARRRRDEHGLPR